jgi:hypothetical protein
MPNRETFLQIADRLLKTNGPLSFRERLARFGCAEFSGQGNRPIRELRLRQEDCREH